MSVLLLKKDLHQLVKSYVNIRYEFKTTFPQAFCEHLYELRKGFPYFESFGFFVETYYDEDTDSYATPFISTINYKVDLSAFVDTSLHRPWLYVEMQANNLFMFPSIFGLKKVDKDNNKIFIDDDFFEALYEIKTLVQQVGDAIVSSLMHYQSDHVNTVIIFDIANKTFNVEEL